MEADFKLPENIKNYKEKKKNYQTAKNVTSEFYDQGDLERKLFDTEPVPMMDRRQDGDIAKMQIGFIDGVCSMVYQVFLHFVLISNNRSFLNMIA